MSSLVVTLAAAVAPKTAGGGSGFQFSVSPDPANAPGAPGIQHAINVFAVYTLMACLAGFLLGGAVWAIGGRVGNDYTAAGGKTGMAVAVGVAFLTGGAAAILQFAYGIG